MSHSRACYAIAATVALLLTGPAEAQSTQDRFWDAAVSGDTIALKGALDAGAAIDSLDTRSSANGRRALNWAALNGRVDALRILLARGASIEARNRSLNTALHHAAEAGSLAATRVLLIAGADPAAVNLDGNRPVDVARRNGHLEVATMLEHAQQGERPTSP